MSTVKCPRCPATVRLTPYFQYGQRHYKSDYGSDFFDLCGNPPSAAGEPDFVSCPYMEEALGAETLRLDGIA